MYRSGKTRGITRDELQKPFEGELARDWPPVLSPAQVSDLLGISVSTLYEWVSKGRLDGAFRRRGKHLLFWRDRLLDIVFNGPAWAGQENASDD